MASSATDTGAGIRPQSAREVRPRVERRAREDSAETREAILDAAEALLVEDGYPSVTSRGVAERAGLKSQLVHYHFGTMDDLLVDHTGEIDFAVIDVEGSELLLLDGFNIEKYRPKVLVIEDNSLGKDTTLEGAIARSGYKPLGWLNVNRICLREDLDWMSRLIGVHIAAGASRHIAA